LNGARIR